jgi:hypothetical protein
MNSRQQQHTPHSYLKNGVSHLEIEVRFSGAKLHFSGGS